MRDEHSERAWAAGLFDGEGTAWASGSGGLTLRGKPLRRALVLQVYQCDVGVLRRLQRALGGAGRLCGPYQQRYSQREIWCWRAGVRSGAEQALLDMLPYLSEPKLAQAARACEAVNASVDRQPV